MGAARRGDDRQHEGADRRFGEPAIEPQPPEVLDRMLENARETGDTAWGPVAPL